MENKLHINKHINKHISAEQLQKYVSGLMTSKERNQLEKHLLDCTFCAEAVEGLESFVGKGGYVTDVELLKHKVDQKVVSSSKKGFPYRELSIAASVLILLSFGLYLFTLDYFSEKDSERIAQNDPEEIKEKVPKIFKNKSDSNIQKSTEMESELLEDMEDGNHSIAVASDTKTLSRDEENMIVAVDDANMEDAIMEEVIVSEFSQPLVEEDKNTIAAELEGGINEGDGVEDSLEAIAIAAKKSKLSSEVVVSAEKSERKNEFPELDQISRKAEPVVGMEAYKKYLEKEINYPETASDNKVRGSVIISFVVGESGELLDMKVEKGLGYGCDEEAIRLLKDGPKWIPSRNDGVLIEERQRIKIKFEK